MSERPAEHPVELHAVPGGSRPEEPAGDTANPAAGGKSPDLAVDVDVINGMIKKYSEEIGLPKTSSKRVGDASAGAKSETESLSRDEAVITASVDALRAAAGEMRRPLEGGMAAIERGILPPLRIDPGSPQPPPVGAAHAHLAALAEAITSQKLDVYLEPIVGLADRKARHFEVSLRLRIGQASIGPEDYIPMARSAGMQVHLDAAGIARAAMVARHMDERGSGGCLFLRIFAESLGNERVLSEIAEACRQVPRLRERLVFSIPQSDVRGLAPAQWSMLRELSASGFRFAIDEITSLDLDLPDLRSAGFAFLRATARALLDGVSSLGGVLAAADLSQRISGTGFTLMAVSLVSEDQLDSILGAGVPLGQGQLFGSPRPVRAEALRPAKSAAA